MATNLGSGVSYVPEDQGYNYDMVVFQKGKPPLDSELNLAQELQNIIAQRNLRSLSSGWLSAYTPYADRSLAPSTTSPLANKFYTQNPLGAKPEFALVNGQVVYVTNTASEDPNSNLIDLGVPPTTGNRVNGVFLEVWRALLDPSNSINKPDPATIIDTLNEMFMIDATHGWICGTNGLILRTTDGGLNWPVIPIDTKRQLNGIHFYNSSLGWVVGDNGTVARSSSAGASWTLLTPSTIVNLNSVHAVSQNVVWAVGENGTVLKAANGVTFVPVSSGITTQLNKVYFTDLNTGWIVGDEGVILRTKNGGVTWSLATSGTTENLNSIYFYNVNFGFAVGNNGVILRSSDGGVTWINQSGNVSGGAITNDLYDVNMFPELDVAETEEVSAQLGATGTTFTVAHTPITGADRKGNVTNNPADVIVTVNGTPVTVLQVVGTTGKVTLATAPGLGAVTMVSYFYQSNCAVFQGKAWIVGATGVVLYTDDIGSIWVTQNSGTAYDLMAVSFVSQTTGWLCGAESVIRNTVGGGYPWTIQQSEVFSRQVQRVYNEGNKLTSIYLDENSIHPDAQIETTARVQVQYRIRVAEAVDPLSNPEAGLSASMLGAGPNLTGSYPYENMGSINGDYGCWRAKCLNTVDGYVYAVPMFFVARRNSAAYSASNPNGQHIKNSSTNIRPDFLLATNVVSSDILDVRHKVVVPSTEELFYKTFDALSANTLQTNFGRSGDQYGTELLAVDTFTGTDVISQAAAGTFGSGSTVYASDTTVTDLVALPTTLLKHYPDTDSPGIFHPDPSFYNPVYISTTDTTTLNGRRVPGQFLGLGSSNASFEFNTNALTSATNINLLKYVLRGKFISDSTSALTYVPSNPQLVTNVNSGATQAYIYQGVLSTDESRVIESWDSGLSGYPNYTVAYPTQDSDSISQQNRSSAVEAHYFIRVSALNLSGGILTIGNTLPADPDSSSIPYNIFTIREIYNKTSGFAHRISNISNPGSGTTISITPLAGYEFISGTILEITAAVKSNPSFSNIRNGAVATFDSRLRGVGKFTQSEVKVAASANAYTITYTDAIILGWSTVAMASGLDQTVCWDAVGMKPVSAVRDPNLMSLQLSGSLAGDATVQLLIQKTSLNYQASGDTLNVGYRYNPYQSQPLSSSLIVEPISGATNIFISTAGSGGGPESEPYVLPIEQIPVNDLTLTTDQTFSNFIQMKFSNFMVDKGFVQMPAIIPGNFYGSTITLSSPSQDALGRTFYSACSRELKFQAEGLQIPAPRKVYVPILARVASANSLYMAGEYVLVVFSRPVLTETENVTGYFPNGNCSISVYRILNRPISRI